MHIVTVGGPSKALELARRVPTAVTYASPQAAVRRRLRQMLETPYYRVEETADQRGLELCSPRSRTPTRSPSASATASTSWPAARRRCTTPSRRSTPRPSARSRGSAGTVGMRGATVHGLGGAGDLHVTGMAGRNRIFGELRGSGKPTSRGGRHAEGARRADRGLRRDPLVLAVRARAEGGRACRCSKPSTASSTAATTWSASSPRPASGAHPASHRPRVHLHLAEVRASRYPFTTTPGAGGEVPAQPARANPMRS